MNDFLFTCGALPLRRAIQTRYGADHPAKASKDSYLKQTE